MTISGIAEPQEVKDWFEIRSLIYSLLARLYQERPSAGFFGSLYREKMLTGIFGETDCEAAKEAGLAMERELALVLADGGHGLTALDEDFHLLFLGPGKLAAPPWESVYRSKEKLTFGEHTLAVRAVYRSFGLEYARKNQEPDDHISTELEFMAWLCRQAAAPLADGAQAPAYSQAQRGFLQDHLLAWVPAFCQDIQDNGRTVFFRQLAALTDAWLAYDCKTLSCCEAE